MNVKWAIYLLAISLSGITAAAQQSEHDELPVAPSSSVQPYTLRVQQPTRNFNRNLPDAPSSAALTDRQKFDVFVESAVSPITVAGAGINAAGQRARAPYGASYSWTRAYTLAVAQRESNEFFGKFLFPALLNQDPRYHPSSSNNVMKRALYAASRVVVTRTDEGHATLNTSYLLSTVLTSSLANAYRPQWARSVSNTAGDIGSTIGGDAGFFIFKEFWPQVGRKLASKTPMPFKRLKEKISGEEPKLDTASDKQ